MTQQRKIHSLRLATVALIAAISMGAKPPEKLGREYFPMAVGDEWIYDDVGDVKGEVRFCVVGTEKIGKESCFVVERTLREKKLKFYLSVSDDGVRIHRVGDDVYDPPYRQFAFPTVNEDSWSWKGKIGADGARYNCANCGVTNVEVPLGKYDAFLVSQSTDDSYTTFYLAKGVGVVYLANKVDNAGGRPKPEDGAGNFYWKLKRFTRGKQEAK